MPVLGFGVYQRLSRPTRAQVVTVMSANLAEAQREVSKVRTVADSIFEETKHTWTMLPDGMEHFQGTMIGSS